MPEMTGAELARRLNKEFPDLPVILATGYAEIAADEAAICPIRLGKPFRLEELAAVMATVRGPPHTSRKVVQLRPSKTSP